MPLHRQGIDAGCVCDQQHMVFQDSDCIVIRDTVAPNTNNPPMEDEWKTISLVGGNLNFSVEGGCPRCSMVDFDPSTGKKGKTLRALASYRRRNGHIVFGIFLRAVATTDPTESQQDSVWIQEGDRLECK